MCDQNFQSSHLIIQSFWVPTFKNIFIFVSSICVSIASPVKIGFPFRSLEIGIVGLQNKGKPGFDYNINDNWKICSLYFLTTLKFIELTIKDFSCPNGSSSTTCGMKQIISLFIILASFKPNFSCQLILTDIHDICSADPWKTNLAYKGQIKP